MKQEDTTESPVTEFSSEIAKKLTALLTDIEDESELLQEIHIKEELIEEVMQDLYKEITSTSTLPPNFLSPSLLPYPSSSSLLSLSFDVKSDSCGPSVSDSASTVMAGVEFVGPIENFTGEKVGSVEMEVEVEVEGDNGERKMDGRDGWEVGDEWLARVLSWGPLELED